MCELAFFTLYSPLKCVLPTAAYCSTLHYRASEEFISRPGRWLHIHQCFVSRHRDFFLVRVFKPGIFTGSRPLSGSIYRRLYIAVNFGLTPFSLFWKVNKYRVYQLHTHEEQLISFKCELLLRSMIKVLKTSLDFIH